MIAFVILVAILKNFETATIDILIAPSSSIISIAGQDYTNGAYKMRPGKYTATIKKDGFEEKQIEIELLDNHITKLYDYLLMPDDNFSWYSNSGHQDDLKILQKIGDEKAKNFIKAISIDNILPISDRQSGIVIDKKLGDCTKNFCLKVTGNLKDNYDLVKNLIKQKGYNPEDYEITYFTN